MQTDLILISIVITIAVFLILRMFWLWYWKIDKIVELLENIDINTKKPIKKTKSTKVELSENSKVCSNCGAQYSKLISVCTSCGEKESN